MTTESLIPEKPLAFIQHCVRSKKIKWTYHVNMRMKGRFISRDAIVGSFEQYVIVEEYPDDKYFLSYLVYSHYQHKIFHILFAVDVENENVRVITAYYPSAEEWDDTFKTRRSRS
jgi:hypothetical protein